MENILKLKQLHFVEIFAFPLKLEVLVGCEDSKRNQVGVLKLDYAKPKKPLPKQ